MTPWTIVAVIAASVVAILFLAGVIGAVLRWLLKRPLRPATGAASGFRDGLYFGFVFLCYWLAAHVLGVIGGILYYLAISPLLGEVSLTFLVSKGTANGVFFLGWVWGPGIALVATFITGHRQLARSRHGGSAGEGKGS